MKSRDDLLLERQVVAQPDAPLVPQNTVIQGVVCIRLRVHYQFLQNFLGTSELYLACTFDNQLGWMVVTEKT